MTDVPAGEQAGVPGPLAEWIDRVIATLVDVAIILVAYLAIFIVSRIIGVVSSGLGNLVSGIGSLAVSVYGLYLGYLEGAKGQSPGKAIRGLKVVKIADGEVLGGVMGIVRRLAHIVDSIICYIGWLFPLWDPKKQTIADKLVNTVVLKDQERRPLSPEIFTP